MEEQEIRARLLAYAAKVWGFSDTAIEHSFDPLVNLLLGAAAHEMEKIYNEIHSTESRLLLKLTQLLTPDVLTGPVPAHAVCHATPLDIDAVVRTDQHFYFQRTRQAGVRPSYDEIFFTPSGHFFLTPAEVRLLACGNKIFNYKNYVVKETLASSPSTSLPPHVVYIGLEPLTGASDIGNFTLFFDNRNPAEASEFYKDLAKAKFYVGDEELPVSTGIEDMRESALSVQRKWLNTYYSISAQNERRATAFYFKNFITIKARAELFSKKIHHRPIADKIQEVFPEQVFQKVKHPIIWITMELPPRDQPLNLSDIFCATNCFPVLNRKKEEITYRIENQHTIVALQTASRFLDMIAVRTQDDAAFFENALHITSDNPAGTYVLRHSGVGRFDKRNAIEYTQYMLQLLKDESASFSALGRDFIETQIKQVNQLIASMEERVNKALLESPDSVSYLLLNAKRYPDNIFIQFWNTDADNGNGVRPGTRLLPYQGNAFVRDSIVLMTHTFGGKNALTASESIQVYKNSVLSRQRIVTQKDIEMACAAIAGEYLEKVEVKKGVMMNAEIQQNYTRCIEVLLQFNSRITDPLMRENLCREIQVYLDNHSSGMYPFKVAVI